MKNPKKPTLMIVLAVLRLSFSYATVKFLFQNKNKNLWGNKILKNKKME